ncbi:class I SAM-dependent methyltransferase [Candidatus Saccharibacteria bacterium]|nr:class I SAM-dependent methyltransferase [Candidatus Saccharibacteria bacterium]
MSKYSESVPSDIKGAIGWMLDYIKPGASFLDVGCSTGYFGLYIKKDKKIVVDGIELSDDAVEARKKLDKVYSFNLDEKWPLIDSRYDYIFFGDVLEHLRNPKEALIQASKMLKDNGVIFVSIPNVAHMSVRLELLLGNFRYEQTGLLDNTHIQFFTKETFTSMSNDIGLSVELVEYTENDVPKEIIVEYLNKIGLKHSKLFWENINSLESRAYQYKFILKPKLKKENKIKPDLFEKPLRYRDDYISSFQTQLDAIHDHANKQAEIIKHYEDDNNRLRDLLKINHYSIYLLKKNKVIKFIFNKIRSK